MKMQRLKEVCAIKNGYAFKSSEFKDSGTPLIRISNFNNGPVYFDDKTVYIGNENLESKSAFKVEKGDVLIALSGATTGKYGLYTHDKPSLLNQRIGLLKSGLSKDLDHKYFYFYLSELRSKILMKAAGAAQPNISTKEISEFKIPLPPLDQQKKIAAILDAADAYRQKTKALIEKYDELTQSLFLDMFGDPVTNPRGWDKVLFSEIATFHNGDRGKNYPSQSAFIKMGIPFINAGNLSNYAIDNQGLNFISNERFDLLSSGKIKREDILFCLRGSLGKFAVNRTHDIGAIASSLVLIRINNHVTLDYITGLLKTNYIAGLIKKSDNGSSQPNLSAKSVKQFIVPLPSLELQNQFSERVQAIEEQKAQAQASLAQAEDLFNSLLQRAFKGELTKT